MTPATLNLLLNPGVTFGPITFTFKDSNGDPIDLTDYNVWAWVKTSREDLPVQEPKIDLAPTITDAANGQITIYITDEDTYDIEESPEDPGYDYWDLILENTSGERLGPFVVGTFTVCKIITQPYET